MSNKQQIKVYGKASGVRVLAAKYGASETIESCQTSYGFGLSFVTDKKYKTEIESHTHFTGSQLYEVDCI